MELSVRDWMIIVGVILILAVLLDGYRRMRNERRGNIRMALNKQFVNASGADAEGFSSELPNGGARSVGRDGLCAEGESDSEVIDDLFAKPRRRSEAGDDSDLQLEQSVPMLMESVSVQHPPRDEPPETTAESSAVSPQAQTDDVADSEAALEPAPEKPAATNNRARQVASRASSQEVIVINVIAGKSQPFKGTDLLHILLACDMRFGDMNIFHRYEASNGTGAVQFSVANIVEPGVFNLDDIDKFSTPGVCFFLSVPGPEDAMKAYECMVETAQCLVSNLDGELLDESHSALTNQTLEHGRQRIQEFQRRRLAQNA
ncbi:MAG: cell division protein ZipA [Halieaceae bacterium]|nr:cell division protein ZipA [Halieaceae bacterium]